MSRNGGPIKETTIYGAVRSQDQVDAVSKLGINVIQVDLYNEKYVLESVLSNKSTFANKLHKSVYTNMISVDIVVHAASSIVTPLAVNLIKALGKRREEGGKLTYFVHVRISSL